MPPRDFFSAWVLRLLSLQSTLPYLSNPTGTHFFSLNLLKKKKGCFWNIHICHLMYIFFIFRTTKTIVNATYVSSKVASQFFCDAISRLHHAASPKTPSHVWSTNSPFLKCLALADGWASLREVMLWTWIVSTGPCVEDSVALPSSYLRATCPPGREQYHLKSKPPAFAGIGLDICTPPEVSFSSRFLVPSRQLSPFPGSQWKEGKSQPI